MTQELQYSLLFTTEPELIRALAAEIRHQPDRIVALLKERLPSLELGDITSVSCEEKRIDMVLTFRKQEEVLKVGIEAKCDHSIDSNQLEREREHVDALILLVLEKRDAEDYLKQVDGVVTWCEAISCFDNSRVTQWDIEKIPATKRSIERVFSDEIVRLQDKMDSVVWKVSHSRYGSGMPHIDFETNERITFENGLERHLRGNIQVRGRGYLGALEDVRLQTFIGIEIVGEEDFPAPSMGVEPLWIVKLKELDGKILRPGEKDVYPEFGFRNKVGTRRKSIPNMTELVNQYIFDKRYLIKGFQDWAFGVKSAPYSLSDLKDRASATADILTRWRDLCIEA
ncbi:hypothetical protein BLEM_1308 [Bifidobacterium lemurum]|uniref:PD-(D/E)XK nuclease superfamily n=1 Tax=Bifidobacterium lemurum TaxID=1603886 RepID=A0A261FRG1_9BIFI|nr:hypothetical protein [Bifidobacterium lemurum]OZG61771.1 hypothetical protein BLEM_1308 [Bifidobacterium lemurum]QOL34925.1 hypothetical protein BL8807_03280 [Bifidobacterium lemurum]